MERSFTDGTQQVHEVVGWRHAYEPQHLGPSVQATSEASHQGHCLGQQAVPHPFRHGLQGEQYHVCYLSTSLMVSNHQARGIQINYRQLKQNVLL